MSVKRTYGKRQRSEIQATEEATPTPVSVPDDAGSLTKVEANFGLIATFGGLSEDSGVSPSKRFRPIPPLSSPHKSPLKMVSKDLLIAAGSSADKIGDINILIDDIVHSDPRGSVPTNSAIALAQLLGASRANRDLMRNYGVVKAFIKAIAATLQRKDAADELAQLPPELLDALVMCALLLILETQCPDLICRETVQLCMLVLTTHYERACPFPRTDVKSADGAAAPVGSDLEVRPPKLAPGRRDASLLGLGASRSGAETRRSAMTLNQIAHSVLHMESWVMDEAGTSPRTPSSVPEVKKQRQELQQQFAQVFAGMPRGLEGAELALYLLHRLIHLSESGAPEEPLSGDLADAEAAGMASRIIKARQALQEWDNGHGVVFLAHLHAYLMRSTLECSKSKDFEIYRTVHLPRTLLLSRIFEDLSFGSADNVAALLSSSAPGAKLSSLATLSYPSLLHSLLDTVLASHEQTRSRNPDPKDWWFGLEEQCIDSILRVLVNATNHNAALCACLMCSRQISSGSGSLAAKTGFDTCVALLEDAVAQYKWDVDETLAATGLPEVHWFDRIVHLLAVFTNCVEKDEQIALWATSKLIPAHLFSPLFPSSTTSPTLMQLVAGMMFSRLKACGLAEEDTDDAGFTAKSEDVVLMAYAVIFLVCLGYQSPTAVSAIPDLRSCLAQLFGKVADDSLPGAASLTKVLDIFISMQEKAGTLTEETLTQLQKICKCISQSQNSS